MNEKLSLPHAELDRIYKRLTEEGSGAVRLEPSKPAFPLCTVDPKTGDFVPIDPESDLGKALLEEKP